MKKNLTFITVFLLTITLLSNSVIAANPNYNSPIYFEGEYFQVRAYIKYIIGKGARESIATTSYDGTNVQIYAKNTSVYGNNLTGSTSQVGYEGGTLEAIYAVSTGYQISECVAYGNVKTVDGDMVSDTITARR